MKNQISEAIQIWRSFKSLQNSSFKKLALEKHLYYLSQIRWSLKTNQVGFVRTKNKPWKIWNDEYEIIQKDIYIIIQRLCKAKNETINWRYKGFSK